MQSRSSPFTGYSFLSLFILFDQILQLKLCNITMMHCLMKTVKKQARKKEADFLMVRENRQVEIQHRQKRFTGPLFPCFIPHEKATKNQPFGGAVCFFGVFLLPLFRRKGREVSCAVQKCFTCIFVLTSTLSFCSRWSQKSA